MSKIKPAEVAVANLGPVQAFSFQTPVPGGVVVLEGGQGVGKSTVIGGVSRLLGGKSAALSAYDGAPRGSLAIDEAILRVTRSQQRTSGELEVTGIESRLDIGALVDPGFAEPETNDRHRLAALVSLSGVVARPELFYGIVGGEEAYKALAVDDKTDDMILLTTRVKKALEAAARAAEGQAEKARAEYQATRATFEDLDLDGPHDAAALSLAQEEAAGKLAAMKAHNEGAAIAARAVALAQRKLEDLGERSESPEELRQAANVRTDEAAEIRLRSVQLRQEAAELRRRAEGLIEQAARADKDAEAKTNEAVALEERADDAEEGAKLRAQLAEDAARSVPTPYSEEELLEAEAAVLAARSASERGAVIRRAREQEAKAEQLHRAAKELAKRGEDLRERARSTDVVLSSVLPEGCPLSYANGRLVLQTDRDEREPYSDLSHGERWKVAIDIVAPLVKKDGRKGLLTLPQEAWEALDIDNQRNVVDLATAHEIVILTAQATRGPLTASVLTAEPETAAEGS